MEMEMETKRGCLGKSKQLPDTVITHKAWASQLYCDTNLEQFICC